MEEKKITKEEIIEKIRNIDPFYEEHILCIENIVTHTLKILKDKKIIKITKTKGKEEKKEKVDIFRG